MTVERPNSPKVEILDHGSGKTTELPILAPSLGSEMLDMSKNYIIVIIFIVASIIK